MIPGLPGAHRVSGHADNETKMNIKARKATTNEDLPEIKERLYRDVAEERDIFVLSMRITTSSGSMHTENLEECL